jgi:phospho-N-acetylmuramoyl-pentapeptide-transferase
MEAFWVVLKILTLGILNIFISLLIFPLVILFLNKIKAKKEIFKENAPIFQSLHAKKSGTPTMGGLIFWISPLVLILFLSFISFFNVEFGKWINFLNRRETYLPLGFLVLGGVIGAIDDLLGIFAFKNRRGLQIKEKLLIYFGFSLIVVWWFITKLGIKYIYIPFLGRYYLSFFLFALFMIIYIIAVSFSANETDGLDGLLGGVSLSILGVLAVISFINGNYNLTSLTVVIMSAVLCFLWYNIYPAKIFMGDTGSMALGSYIAIVSLLEGVYFLIPIIAPVFVIESGSVILQTLSKKIFKKKIFLSTPIHHHFEAKGLHEANIVFKFWVINAIGAAIGLIIFLLDKLI